MQWVKASERLPDNHKNVVSRFVGESGKNFMSAMVDGYFYADSGAYHPSLIEWLDETTCGDGWVSVEERLPEEFEPVLIFLYREGAEPTVLKAEMGANVWSIYYSSGVSSIARTDTVTHWMPLPLPPSPKKAKQ